MRTSTLYTEMMPSAMVLVWNTPSRSSPAAKLTVVMVRSPVTATPSPLIYPSASESRAAGAKGASSSRSYCTRICRSLGYSRREISSVPSHRDRVPESITITMVQRMQMLARPTAFCFMR